MSKNQKYDLEERTFNFAEKCKIFILKVPKSIPIIEYLKQLARSSASVAANYIEANESLSRKDYFHRVRICRKEAKESRMWLRLINCDKSEQSGKEKLAQEAFELTKIFGAILERQ